MLLVCMLAVYVQIMGNAIGKLFDELYIMVAKCYTVE